MKFLIVLFTFFLNVSAKECDCDSIKGAKDADVVFKGKVLKVQRVETPYIRYEVTFQVTKWKKGAGRKKNMLLTHLACWTPAVELPFKQENCIRFTPMKKKNVWKQPSAGRHEK